MNNNEQRVRFDLQRVLQMDENCLQSMQLHTLQAIQQSIGKRGGGTRKADIIRTILSFIRAHHGTSITANLNGRADMIEFVMPPRGVLFAIQSIGSHVPHAQMTTLSWLWVPVHTLLAFRDILDSHLISTCKCKVLCSCSVSLFT
jgi:hypothetical protein